MKRLRKVSEAQVIAEFLKNEFYQDDFHYDREKYENVVLEPNLDDDLENAIRRALLFRRRGHMWRELPVDTEWWLVQLESHAGAVAQNCARQLRGGRYRQPLTIHPVQRWSTRVCFKDSVAQLPAEAGERR